MGSCRWYISKPKVYKVRAVQIKYSGHREVQQKIQSIKKNEADEQTLAEKRNSCNQKERDIYRENGS